MKKNIAISGSQGTNSHSNYECYFKFNFDMLNRDVADGMILTKTPGASAIFAAAIFFFFPFSHANIVLK